MAGSRGLTFPIEVWREIFDNVSNQHERLALVHICHALSDEARAVLYQKVILKNHKQAMQFYQALLRSSGRAAGVKQLNIQAVTNWDGFRIPVFLPLLFKMLFKLRKLVLGFCLDKQEQNYPITEKFVMDPRWFPRLQVLVTSIPLTPSLGFSVFFTAHPALEQLHASNFNHINITDDIFRTPVPLPSLCVAACLPQFLLHNITGAKSLTHLNLHECTSEVLVTLAEVFGEQLMSLRLIKPRITEDPWSIHEMAIAFPRLSYLHIDMENPSNRRRDRRPFINSLPVDWAHKPQSVVSAGEQRAHKLTVVWAYPQEEPIEHEETARAWRLFFLGATVDVLTRWAHYIERVLVLHPAAPGILFSRGAGGKRMQVDPSNLGYNDWMYV